jgi:hypothetical protein
MGITADEVLVSVSADFAEYNRASEQATAAFADNMRDAAQQAQAAATKAEAALKAEADAVTAARQREIQANEALNKSAQESAAAARASIQSIIQMNDQLAASYAKLAAASEAAKKAREALNATPNTGGAGGGGATNATGAGVLGGGGLGGGFGGSGNRQGGAGGISNISYQLQDFIVQVTSGQGVLRSFSQQAPQLLSGFGPWGAILGVAAAATSVLGIALGSFETAAEKAAATQKAFTDAMAASKGAFTDQEQAAFALTQSLSLVERGYIGIAQQEISTAMQKNTDAFVSAQKDTAAAAVGTQGTIIQATIDAKDAGNAVAPVLSQVYELTRALRDPGITPAGYNQVLVSLRALQPAAKDAGLDLTTLLDTLAATGASQLKLADSQTQLAATQGRLNELNTLGAKLLTALGLSAAEATGHIDGLSGSMTGYAGVLQRVLSLSGATAGAINGVVATLRQQDAQMGDTVKSQRDYADKQQAVTQGQAAWTEEIKNGGNPLSALAKYAQAYNLQLDITRKTQAASNQGKSTAAQDLADLQARNAALDGTKATQQRVTAEQNASRAANAAYSKALAETGDETAAQTIKSKTYATQLAIETKQQQAATGAAKGSAAARQEASLDKSNLKIQQQIDLNTRLIAVYGQGEAARDKVKAQYDAETAARAANLKVGTDQYNSFVAQYTAQAEALRASNALVTDYGKADAVTKSLRTSQETYNQTLAQYVVYLGEGAFTATEYDRAVKALNASNDGYKEGIEAVGQAIQGGIQGATSFTDALTKIGLALAQLLIQAALFGTGGFGKLFDSLAGTSGGLLGALGGLGSDFGGSSSALGAAGAALSLVPRASGGTIIPGTAYKVGEGGPETFVSGVPGTVIPNGAIGGGGGNVTHDVKIQVTGTTDRELVALVTAATQRSYKQSLRDMPKALSDYNKRRN